MQVSISQQLIDGGRALIGQELVDGGQVGIVELCRQGRERFEQGERVVPTNGGEHVLVHRG